MYKSFVSGILIALIFLQACAGFQKKPAMTYAEISEKINHAGLKPSPYLLVVNTENQRLLVYKHGVLKENFVISTGKNGIGQTLGSFKTPLGLHRINDKIGEGVPPYGIFNRRQYVGVTWTKVPRYLHKKDYISTRILRLEGLELGLNRGKNAKGQVVDSEIRAIYIHGTTMEWKLGKPFTKGCVHMSTKDVMRLHDEIPLGTLVMFI
ncbi:MAG: L,D-transpeptidase [Gammaproteobacteria bacterium]